MLLNLSLHHFVIVDELQLSFDEGLTVLTGETGAGKSIILDALGLLLGDKADFNQIREGQSEARLSAQFSLSKLPQLRQHLQEIGFLSEDEEELSIRRIIDRKGKSRHFINQQSATLSQLRQLGEFLIDIHGQSAHFSLNHEATQRQILDAFSGSLNEAQEVKNHYETWIKSQNNLNNAIQNQQQIEEEYQRLLWQKNELDKLNPQPEEWQELNKNYDILANAADLINASETVEHHIHKDQGIYHQISLCQKELSDLSNIEPCFAESLQLLQSIEVELSEISSNLRDVKARIEIDPQTLAEYETRMSELSSYAKKYRIDIERLPEKHQEMSQKIEQLSQTNDLTLLQKECQIAEKNYQQAAAKLSKLRQTGAQKFSQEVSEIMHTLSMEGAQFQAILENCEPSTKGNERIIYHASLNRGSKPQILTKIASGGELARISLAIQVAASKHTAVPTLIFDEVDSGIGGRVANTIGQRLSQLSENYQVLLITHLAQVAAYANEHWQVSKHDKNGITTSTIHKLDENQRITEIARMMGGESTSQTTLQHAEELIHTARVKK